MGTWKVALWVIGLLILVAGLMACSSAPRPVLGEERGQASAVGGGNAGGTAGIEVVNRGGAGDVYVRAAVKETSTDHTLVLAMRAGERVTLWVRLGGTPASGTVEWSARAAKEGDRSSGNMIVERAD